MLTRPLLVACAPVALALVLLCGVLAAPMLAADWLYRRRRAA